MWVWNKLDKVWTLNPRRVWNCCFSFTQARYFNQSQPISSLTQAGGYTLLTRMKWFTEFIDLLRSLCKVPTGGALNKINSVSSSFSFVKWWAMQTVCGWDPGSKCWIHTMPLTSCVTRCCCLTSLGLSFPICRRGIIIAPTALNRYEN